MSTHPSDPANHAPSNNLNCYSNLYPLAHVSAKKEMKQWCPWAFAFSLLLGLMTIGPSAQAQTFTTLYSFTGGADGAYPSGLIRDSAGNLYGTTNSGGSPTCTPPSQGCGTVFKLDPSSKLTVLYHFTGKEDGEYPSNGVIRDAAGNLYGTTLTGGDLTCTQASNTGKGCGTVFKLDARGHKTVLHRFTGIPGDGAVPEGGLIQDAAGNLYGVTGQGGHCIDRIGCGTVFKVDASGQETVLFDFDGGPQGNVPVGLTQDAAGNLIGTAEIGGVHFAGVVFKLDSAGKETILHNFAGGGDGQFPNSRLVQSGQHFYGTTTVGGANSGTVFKIDETGKEAVVYSFAGPPDGSGPEGTLIHDAAGTLYGTTFTGGNSSCFPPYGCGTVFRLDTNGQEKVLYRFTDTTDGNTPASGVIRDAAGNLYGTTNYGGAYGFGTIFKITL